MVLETELGFPDGEEVANTMVLISVDIPYRILSVMHTALNNVRFKKNRGALQTECIFP